MPKSSANRTAGVRRTATNRKGTQRKRVQRRRETGNRFRKLESALVQTLPQNWGKAEGQGLRLPALPDLSRLRRPNLAMLGATGLRPSKIASLLLLALTVTLLYWTESAPGFYVYADSVDFGSLAYLSPDELYARTDLEGLSIFWVEADQVKAQIMAHPYVTGAKVSVGLPGRVVVSVQEASPVAVWITDGGELWLLPDGTALGSRATTNPDLVRIIDGPQSARSPQLPAAGNGAENGIKMEENLLQSALTLSHYLPGLTNFRYAVGPGLYFTLPGTQTLVYWGDGNATDAKLTNLISILRTLDSAQQTAQRIDVRYENKPYYK